MVNRLHPAWFILALTIACDAPDPEALYLAGDYLAAREFYNPVSCAARPVTEADTCHARADGFFF